MIPFILAAVGGYLILDSTITKEVASELSEEEKQMRELTKKILAVPRFAAKSYKKGGKTGQSFLHIYRLKYPNYNKIYVLDDVYMSPMEAMSKMGINLYPNYGTWPTSYKYSGVPSDSEKYKKWYQLKKKGDTDEEAYEKVFEKYDDGGQTEDDDMSVEFFDYKGEMIMFEPHFKKYYSNDIEFDSLEKVKKYIDSGSKPPSWERSAYRSEIMENGGEIKIGERLLDLGTVSSRKKKINGEIYNLLVNDLFSVRDDFRMSAEAKLRSMGYQVESIGTNLWVRKPMTDVGVANDIYYGVVDANNKLVFQSENEKEAKQVSNSYENSIVKKYKGKVKMADGGAVKDGYVVYFGVFRGRGLNPVITEYYENKSDAEKSIEDKKAKKEKGWKLKELSKMPINSEVRMSSSNENYKKVKGFLHSKEKVDEFFQGKDSFYKKDYAWVKPDGYEWDNWELKKK